MNGSAASFAPYNPVAKLQWLERVAMERLTAAELAIAALLANRANSTHGRYFHSFAQFTEELSYSKRTLKTAMASLLARGILRQPRIGGGRGHASEYEININYTPQERGKSASPFSGEERVQSASPFPIKGAVFCTKGCSFLHERGKCTSPQSIHETDSESVSMNEGRDGQRGGALPAPPSTVNREDAPITTWQDRHPSFWLAYPFRADVAAVENMLDTLAGSGAPMDAIIAGAARYARYCAANPKMRMAPGKWLEGQRWRDDWTLPGQVDGKTRGKAKEEGGQGEALPASKAHADSILERAGEHRAEYEDDDFRTRLYAERIENAITQTCAMEADMEEEDLLEPLTPWPLGQAADFANWLYRYLMDTEGNKPGMGGVSQDDLRASKDDLIYRLTNGTRKSRMARQNAWGVPICHVLGDVDDTMAPEHGCYLDAWKLAMEAQRGKRTSAASALAQARAALAMA